MPKFEKKYCYCMWDDELKGKRCFIADDINILQRVVEVNDTAWLRDITGKSTCAPFPFSYIGNYYRFCYHDPYYELKLAREEGKVIQRYWKSEQEWEEYIGDDFPDDISLYRIKPEEQKPVTSREISRWLAQGNGEYRAYNDKVFPDVRRTEYLYEQDTEPVTAVKIRKWEDEEWHEPTREYMGLEG